MSTSLVDLLDVSLVLRQLAPYLPVRALVALSRTCTQIRTIITTQSDAWRHLDLTSVKSARIDSAPIDVGGVSWRAERMDESLSEEDFYAGPLRGILNRLHTKWILKFVQTLVLDGLSVPADLVREIVAEDRYNVKILSLREAKNLNLGRLQQVLRYIVRPTRAKGTPRLKALYVFGPKESMSLITQHQPSGSNSGITTTEGAQIGAEWNQRSSSALTETLSDEQTKWYCSTGRALRRQQSDWADTMQVCRGLIAFDAVLCRGPRHDITKVQSMDFLQPTIASVALGPAGCESCGSCPEGPAIFGQSAETDLPLLGPPPLHASAVRAAQRPDQLLDSSFPKLILRCEDCLRGRWCERCNRWWCEDCYTEPRSRTPQAPVSASAHLTGEPLSDAQNGGDTGPVKVIGVHRDCFGCGRTCNDCKSISIRNCRNCRTEYCLMHDEGCSGIECAWCSHGGRRTRELY